MSDFWISSAISHPGALRKSMGVKKGQKISETKLNSTISKLHNKSKKGNLTESESKMLKRANLAKTLKKFHK